MSLLRKIAFPIALLYGLVVHLRNLLFDIGWLPVKTFSTPTICVGNLSVGGTGKTPMIEFLIHHLSKEAKLAVLSRGYRRKSKGFQLANKHSTVEQLGDEPFQIWSKFKNITVAVDADRSRGIQNLEKIVAPDIILMDDAFQHRKVNPSFSILLTTYTRPYYKDWFLPTGTLRDARKAAKRASAIVVTKCPSTLSGTDKESLTLSLRKNAQQPIYFSSLAYASTLGSQEGTMPLMKLKNERFTLVTGIANPQPLVHYLEAEGLQFEHLQFSDHHFFSEKELTLLNRKGLLITTEKDYTRLEGKVERLYFIQVAHHFLDDGMETILHQIRESIKPGSPYSP
ncbi:MAG: tetraacyldisaccharide 4'-kinase [Bacteroidota bacterium]